MGSRYMVIEFDDDAAADNFKRQIERRTREGKLYRVVGMFARPGKTCICSAASRGYSNRDVKRGGKFGWWVCTNCGKPRLGNHELKNLMTPDEVTEPRAEQGVDRMSRMPSEKPYVTHPLILGVVTYPQAVAQSDAA